MIGIRVTGLNEAVRNAKRAGVQVEDLKEGFQRIGQDVVDRARPRVPRRTGALAGTLRTARQQNKVVVRIGGARARYARFVVFGSKHNPKPSNPVYAVIQGMDLETKVINAVNDALREAGLDAQ